MTMIDLTNKRFGRLVVQKSKYTDRSRNSYWICKCDCGAVCVVCDKNFKTGHTKSCGCLNREVSRVREVKHDMSRTKVYNTWCRMKYRCFNRKCPRFKYYGGRQIGICLRWLVFENFYADMGDPPTLKHSIDRIDNEGDYTPSNCRWATAKEQANNRRRVV